MDISLPYDAKQEEKDRKRGMILSFLMHLILLIILLIPFISFPFPKPELQGVLVTFGQIDEGAGQGDVIAEAESEPEVEPTKAPAEKSKPAAAKPTVKEATKEPVKKVQNKTKTEDASVISAADKKKNEEAKRKAEEEKQRQLEEKRKAEAEAQEKAEEDAKRKAEAARKKKEAEDKKKQFGNVFGESKGNNGTEGEQGDPKGDPNAKALEGLVDAKGEVGSGLSDRGVVFEPKIVERSQKTGIVVVEICIDGNGNVTSANYTQRGSTTTDSELVNVAIKNAKKYKFGKGELDKQCGNINIDFKLK